MTEPIIDPCVHCGESTAFGHGRFVNRIPCDDGWGCAECSGYECDRCDKQIYLDCEVTPDQCGSDKDEFPDGTRHVCEDCLTPDEAMAYWGFDEPDGWTCQSCGDEYPDDIYGKYIASDDGGTYCAKCS